jgi:heavy metal sensor kinase
VHSLRLKLILGFLLVLAAVIAGFDFFIYTAKRNALFDVMDGRLYAETQAVSRHLELDGAHLSFDPAEENGARPPLPSVFRVAGLGGAILAQSPSAGAVPWPALAPGGANPQWRTIGAGRAGSWRVATWTGRLETDAESSAKSKQAGEASVGVVVQCAELLSSAAEELRELASLLAALSLAAFLIAGGGSFLLAGRALRPIRRVNAALEKVSETNLDRRLDPSSFDRELHPLIIRLNEALERLEKGFQRERQFTADASHELRTPLAVLLNSIEVLLRRPRTEAELVEACRDNEKTARSMQSVVEGLLLLARMDSGKAGPAKGSVAPAGLIDGLFALIGGEAEAKGVRLVHSVDPALTVRADPAQLRLALLNLIDNAVRYNRHGGRVSIEARRTGVGTVIEVHDTGIGIPPEHLSRIFERFYRVDPSRAEATGGCGLGLSIVRKIVEGHGGRVSVSSGPDGSVFTIVLPDA